MSHDVLFKELLRTFLPEFLALFFPRVAAGLDFSQLTFLDKEVFTDLPEGSRRELDLVAQAQTRDGQPELILLHMEVQAHRERQFPFRMFEYYALLRLRYRLPVFPIVIYLSPGAGGLVEETYNESLLGHSILDFRYQCVGLPDLKAESYVAESNPLAPALAALMKPEEQGRARQKAQSLKRIFQTEIDEARRSLLLNLIETYFILNESEQLEYEQIAVRELPEEMEMLTVYEERGIAKGLEQGLELGREEGLELGREEGKREALLKLARLRFGDLPETALLKLQSVETEDELDRLLERIALATTLEETGLIEA